MKRDLVLPYLQFTRTIKQKDTAIYLCVVRMDTSSVSTFSTHSDQLKEYILRKFPKVFPEKLPSVLPPSDRVQHAIDLVPDYKVPPRRLYRQTVDELNETKRQIEEYLAAGHVRPSTSPFGAPVLLVRKKDGTMRMCVDYRALNDITCKNTFPIPRIDDLHDQLARAKFFTKLDLYSGYHQIPIRQGDEYKTAFTSRYGTYEFLVMPFGLTNAPATFQTAMNTLFYEWLDKFVIVYLDDILIYSPDIKTHYHHVTSVIQRLHKHKWYCKLKKCDFATTQVEYLGHIVSNGTLAIDPSKMDAVLKWPTPMKNLKEVQSFLGLLGYYRKFIPHFSYIARPLHAFARKDVKFVWNSEHTKAVDELKKAITSPQCLAIFDHDRKTTLTTDACDYAVGAVLSQKYDAGDRPIAFISKLLAGAQLNYSMWEKELLAIVWAVKELRPYLRATSFDLVTDNKPSAHILKSTNLKMSTTASNRVMRWLIELQTYSYNVIHKNGVTNVVADALSRFPLHTDVAFHTSEDAHFFQKNLISFPSTSLIDDFIDAYKRNPKLYDLYVSLNKGTPHVRFTILDKFIVTRDVPARIYLPDDSILRTKLFTEIHDTPSAGHPGFHKMISHVRRHFVGPKLHVDVLDYVRSCPSCQIAKPRNTRAYGTLLPLQPPEAPWQDVSLDLITQLPLSDSYDSIFVIVDRFSKMAYFTPTNTTADALQLAHLFLKRVVFVHGLPRSIVSDRDRRFLSSFWTELFEQLHTTLRFSTANHPQTDGQTERTNRTLEQYLRIFVRHRPNEWNSYLQLAEFSYNTSTHSALGFSPYYVVYNQHPSLPLDFLLEPVQTRNDTVQHFVNDRKDMLDCIRQQLQRARDEMIKHQPKKQIPSFQPSDMVLVHRTAFRSSYTTTLNKFDDRWYGPFEILKVINPNAYKIKLPDSFRHHNVINVGFLHPYRYSNKFPRQHPDFSRPPAETDASHDDTTDPEYEVESILKHRLVKSVSRATRLSVSDQLKLSTNKNDYEFLIKWKGYPTYESTWEPFANLANAKGILRSYLSGQELPLTWLDE